ncbi:hypothetical protein BKK56_04970 [Rodentibacter genomosp. 2]|nr:hypothetical protein BKK56_04970 [Rodentibacter genomosp. 2]
MNSIFLFRELRPDTEKAYQKVVNQLLKFYPDKSPHTLTKADVVHWRAEVLFRIKPVTWNNYCRHLKSLYNFAIEQSLIENKDNPLKKMMVREGKTSRKVLDETIFKKIDLLFKSEENLPSRLKPKWFILCLINVLKYTGIRRAQLVKLRVKDIDLSRKMICIPSHINKNHKYHEIPIPQILFTDFEKIADELKRTGDGENAQFFNVNRFSTTNYRQGEMMTNNQLSHIFYVLSKEIRCKVSPHRFRHTLATKLIKNKTSIYDVKRILGHSDLKVTMSYIEEDPEDLRSALDSVY